MPTSLTTRLTELLDLTIPIMSAPMAGIASGDLAAAVSRAGGLGLIGGGYGDRQWLARELDIAVDAGWRSPKVRRSSSRKDPTTVGRLLNVPHESRPNLFASQST